MAYQKIDCSNPRRSSKTGEPVRTIHRATKGFTHPPEYTCGRCGERLFRVHQGESTFWGSYVIEEEP